MRALGDVLREWKPAAIRPRDPLTLITRAWPEIAGEKIAAHSRPQSIEHGVLVIVTRSNAWSQQLSFLSERIIAALHERNVQPSIVRLRFKVGRVVSSATVAPSTKKPPARSFRHKELRRPAADAREAFAHFRSDVEALQRAKATAGWNPCKRCGALIAPPLGLLCATCADAHEGERAGQVERLFYETPWLGYDGVAGLVEGLTREEYDGVRLRLLKRWWDTLRRAERAGRLSPDGRERLIASSYVLLKSGIAPEEIAPATVRNLLGDPLHDLIYGSKI